MSEARGNDFRVLILAPFGKDASLIAEVLRESGLSACAVATAVDLAAAIGEGAGSAIVSEDVLHAEEIGLLARQLANQPAWSDFPIIVLTGGGMSTAATDSAARSREPLGNVSLLERPLRPATLISAVRSALVARQRQYEIRDHLLRREQAEEALRRAHDELESVVEQRTEALRRLSARLLRVQDEERRRIARELHDSLGQYLTAAKINLDIMARTAKNGSPYLKESQQLIERAISDTRTLSHLLHPPLLDEAGFVSAAKWYVEGFGKRSGIATQLEISDRLERLAPELETALFRVLQEALTNVHRHSGSKSVQVSLSTEPSVITLSIQDHGKGIPPEALKRFRKSGTNVGVGLAGIRERIKELGGTLLIDSGPTGTLLRVEVPIRLPARRQPPGSNAIRASKTSGTVLPSLGDSSLRDQLQEEVHAAAKIASS
ncbi:MAG TPA: ATP-binding protein [Terriglobales bacterium]